ncbi:MAG TPA: sugar phosphate isomerase/epimerase family protein [Roseiflexaceae bacterium]|nr:sugar phosphate isomerase/epimerase family protein [Roseiflexaceae bacterium]
MKLSCLPVSLYADFASGRRSLGDWFRLAADLGLDGADLSVAHVASRAPAYLDGLRREAEDAGVRLVMLATYSDFTQPDAAERARQVEDVRAWVEAAARLGASFLRLTAGQAHPGVAEADGLAWAAAGLTACLDEAAAAGVTLLYENHVRGAVWSANDFTQPAARFLEVVRRTAGSGLRILFDTANPLALGDDPLALLEQVRERVGAVHLSDIRRAGAFEPVVLGTGVAPIPALLRALVAGGFDGWLSIEEASRTGEQGFRQAVAYARAAWGAALSTDRTL